MATQHKTHGSSTATRLLGCPPWHNITVKYAPKVKREAGPAAERGHKLHDIMEAIYDRDGDIGELTKDLEPADREAVEYAYNMTEALLNAKGIEEYECEQFLEISEDVGGTPDMLAWSDEVFINLDYKFGRNPIENRDQFLFGFMAALQDPTLGPVMRGKKLLSAVVQPEVSTARALVQEHTWEELQAFIDRYYDALEIADRGGLEGTPGGHCKYCPAGVYCPARRTAVTTAVQALDPHQQDTLAECLELLPQLEEFVRAVKDESRQVIEDGGEVPGWKMVVAQRRRFWRDPDAVMHKLRYHRAAKKDMYITETLKSPAQVESALKKAKADVDLAQFIEEREYSLKIVPEADKRPAKIFPGKSVPAALDKVMGG